MDWDTHLLVRLISLSPLFIYLRLQIVGQDTDGALSQSAGVVGIFFAAAVAGAGILFV